jgi:DNA-binding transcriptional MerR regulator
MKQILESLDISEEIKEELSESFDAAVLVEAVKLAESKEEAYEEYMMAQLEEMKAELEDTLDAYLEKVVEQFVEDNTFAIEESIKSEKYDAVLEGFNSLMIATGVEIAQIAEAKEEIEGETNESAEALADKLMEENMELKERNAELLKTGLVKESAEDMTAVQRDKFLKLARVVEFDENNPVDFIEKMDTLVESVKGEKVVAEKAQKVEEKMIVENVGSAYVTKASHLF